MEKGKVAFVGLGKLGLSIATCFASRGYRVFGVDINKEFVSKINSKKAPFYEPDLQELLDECVGKMLTASTDYSAINEARWIFVIVPTPSNADGSYLNTYVEAAAKSIGEMLKMSREYKVVSITSTVSPNTMTSLIKPLLEKVSGKNAGSDFGLVYNPEFIAIGSLIRDFLNQEMVLIGQDDEKAGKEIEALYLDVCTKRPNIARMSLLNAEITKVAYNSFMTTKVTFANMLAEICNRVEGADVDQITTALGLDTKIGNQCLKGGIGYGGPCWPRDNKALLQFAIKSGYSPMLPKAIDDMNLAIPYHIADTVERLADKNRDAVVILGLSYKPNTPLTVESQSVMIAKILSEKGFRLLLHNPIINREYSSEFKKFNNVQLASSLEECLSKGTVFILATPWEEYKKLSPRDFTQKGSKRVTIIDCWRSLRSKIKDGGNRNIRYIAWGVA